MSDDLLKRVREGQCPENLGCGTMNTCACALLTELSDALTAAQERVKVLEKVEAVARQAICSIGSFDRGLQSHYEKMLKTATQEGKHV